MLLSLEPGPVLTRTQANCGTALKLPSWVDTFPTQLLRSLLSDLYSDPVLHEMPPPPSLENYNPQTSSSPPTMEEVGFNDRQFAIQYVFN